MESSQSHNTSSSSSSEESRLSESDVSSDDSDSKLLFYFQLKIQFTRSTRVDAWEGPCDTR